AFIYLNSGAISPMIVIPSIIGIMLGTVVGVKILEVARPKVIRIMVLGLLFLSGLRALLKGFGIWN
ncbi:MAG: sulfite exporter TauE/SafE family protein, partial [Thermodesulfobacterium sp.]|nr:sulfite exporter TauE/SafE family protein [Thermodesulfobacterium sp.]